MNACPRASWLAVCPLSRAAPPPIGHRPGTASDGEGKQVAQSPATIAPLSLTCKRLLSIRDRGGSLNDDGLSFGRRRSRQCPLQRQNGYENSNCCGSVACRCAGCLRTPRRHPDHARGEVRTGMTGIGGPCSRARSFRSSRSTSSAFSERPGAEARPDPRPARGRTAARPAWRRG